MKREEGKFRKRRNDVWVSGFIGMMKNKCMFKRPSTTKVTKAVMVNTRTKRMIWYEKQDYSTIRAEAEEMRRSSKNVIYGN